MASDYAYKAADPSGRIKNGTLTADSPQAVERSLRSSGFLPLEIVEANAGMKREISFGKGRVKLKDLAIFSRQFAVMISAGLPLLRTVSILTEQTENRALRDVLRVVRSDIENGANLSQALEKHDHAFPPLMVSMVKAGEAGGFLDRTMTQLADSFEADVKLRGKVKSAMTYPIAVLVIALIAALAMLLFVVPVFSGMFEGLGGELPLPTKIMVMASRSMPILLPLLIIGISVSVFTWRKVKNKKEVRDVVDPLKLRLPVFGNLIGKIAIARFARNFSTLLASGVPILQTFDIVGETSGNRVIERALEDVKESVQKGEPVSKPLARHPVFPPMVVQMIAVGEDTGTMDQMLAKVADFYDAEVEAITDSLTALMEPLMIAFVGGIVGAMVISLYLPMFKIFDLIGKQAASG